MKATKIPPTPPPSPDVQVTLTWQEAVELRASIGNRNTSDSAAVENALWDALRQAGVPAK